MLPPIGGLMANVGGGWVSLHAGAWVEARDREKLEKVCRYAARPAVAESRLVGGKDTGRSMKKWMAKYKGLADGKLVQDALKTLGCTAGRAVARLAA